MDQDALESIQRMQNLEEHQALRAAWGWDPSPPSSMRRGEELHGRPTPLSGYPDRDLAGAPQSEG